MKKQDVANTMGILLSLDRVKWKDLMKLPEDTLNQMYRNYNANALSTNHMADKMLQLEDEVRVLKRKLSDSQKDPTKNYTRK